MTSRGWRAITRRTTLLTVGTIASVLVAGAAAIGANFGILNASDTTTLGNLNAGVSHQETDQPVGASQANNEAKSELFLIERVGSIEIVSTDLGLALGTIVTTSGWSQTISKGTDEEVIIVFSTPDESVEFTASLDNDGSIVAIQDDQPIRPAPTSPPAPAAPTTTPPVTTSHDEGSDGNSEGSHSNENEGNDDDDDSGDKHDGGDDDD